MAEIKNIIKEYGLAPKKSLGQNFILDMDILRRIVKGAGNLDNKVVLEVGPGPGGLTRAILEKNLQQLIVLEKDRRCIEALKNTIFDERLIVLERDALEFDYSSLPLSGVKLIANLPYNISTILLIDWLKMAHRFESLTLMFQKEVAQRIIASPGTKDYSRLTVMVQWLCSVKVLFDLSPGAFFPPPKIFSSVVHFQPYAKPLEVPFSIMEIVTRSAFGLRRKMLRSSLKALSCDVEELLRKSDIDPTLRAERLTVENFLTLSKVYMSLSDTVNV